LNSLASALGPWVVLFLSTLLFSSVLVRLSTWLSAVHGRILGLDRKLFHVGIFTGAVPAQLLLGFWGVMVYGSTIALLVLLGLLRGRDSALFRVLGRREDVEERANLVFFPLAATALGGLLSVLLVGEFAVLGYLVCGWGDAAGELVGRTMGRHRYTPLFSLGRRPKRTLEGSAAVLVLGSLGAWAGLGLLQQAPAQAVGVGVACGVAGMLGEAVSGKGTDNFWAQLLPSLLAWWFLG
jgi:dolichol kinase